MAKQKPNGGTDKSNDSVGSVPIVEDGQLKIVDNDGNVNVITWIPQVSGQNVDTTNNEFFSSVQSLYDYYVSVGQLGQVTKYLTARYPALKNSLPGDATYMAAFQKVASEASAYNFQQTHQDPNGQGKTLSILDYLKNAPSGGKGGSGPQTSVSYTLKKSAWDLYRSSYEQLTGRKANPKLFEEFYDRLHKEESKYVSTSNTAGNRNVTTRGTLDVNDFTMRYLINNVNLKGDLKGKLGENQVAIQRAIDESGLAGKVSADAQAKYLKKLANGQMTETDLNDILRQKAAAVYSAFSDDINDKPGLTVKEILDPYTQRYAAYLELDSGSIDYAEVAKMATGQDSKKLGLWDFERSLKKDQRYSYTKQAQNEAQNLARSFARAFGVNV